MGKLVQFERRERGGTAARDPGTPPAEILIFTGVRYERQSDASPPKPTATSSGGKRKRG
ncbi:MAG TPA: hypothetical protein VFE52_06500 [Devosia sp.]|nr:hypothetical protein [Devosia sp.]